MLSPPPLSLISIGALIKGRSSSSSSCGDADQLDGELIARVLRLIHFADERLQLLIQLAMQQQQQAPPSFAGGIRLEVALITFLEQFRRTYVGESVARVSKVFLSLLS